MAVFVQDKFGSCNATVFYVPIFMQGFPLRLACTFSWLPTNGLPKLSTLCGQREKLALKMLLKLLLVILTVSVGNASSYTLYILCSK